MKNGYFQHLTPQQKLLGYVLFVLFMWVFGTMLSQFLVVSIFEIDIETFDFEDFSKMEVIRLRKILNFISHLMIFIIPSVLFAKMVDFSPREFVLSKNTKPRFWIIVPLLFLGLTFLNDILHHFNHSLDFSFVSKEFQEDLEYQQAVNTKAVYAYIGTTWKSFFVNLFLIAIVPAIGEELTFRGVLQHMLVKTSKNMQVGIICSALLFAGIHFQPFNFIPLFALGLIYGYIVAMTGSIWVTILLHFLNNALILVFQYLARIYPDMNISTNIWIDVAVIISAAVTFYIYFKKSPKNNFWCESKGIYLR